MERRRWIQGNLRGKTDRLWRLIQPGRREESGIKFKFLFKQKVEWRVYICAKIREYRKKTMLVGEDSGPGMPEGLPG